MLDRFSFSLAEGETVVIIGEPGCGKEALMRALGGAVERGERVRGSLAWRGGSPEAAERLTLPRSAYWPSVFARPLFARASALSQLARVVSRKTRIPLKSARAEFVLSLERLTGAPPVSNFDVSTDDIAPEVLSWGLFAAAIAQTPELLLADQPLSSLAPTETHALIKALRDEQQRLGFALLYTDMTTDVAGRLGGRLVVLRRGRIVEEGPVSRLATQRAHAYTQTLLGPPTPPLASRPPSAPPTRGHPVIQAIQLGPSHNGKAGLTFELRQGAALALLGERGSGRHRLVRQLLGVEPARPGRVLIDAVDIDVLSRPMRRRLRSRVAMISGTAEILDPRLTIYDTVAEPLRAQLTLPRHLAESCRNSVLKRVGLAGLAGERAVSSLAPSDKRRLQIARAIASAPLLVILDEPLRGLDGFAQSVVRDLLKSFRAEEGPAFLVISEDIRVAAAFAEDVMVLKAGQVIERGRLSDILEAPGHDYTRSLIEACGVQRPLPATCAAG